eukprot:TRINITY_DN12144_c0_g3_i1.p1 TRINITY_DN12144_c0_g3~~TRINITY_DN12144_c0_g3_i1.p1  ORF type:complete len:336 (-),score=32.97 TRINITY_DN12144_c0_g3_i1:251-1258(-)
MNLYYLIGALLLLGDLSVAEDLAKLDKSQANGLQERVQQLIEISKKRGIIRFNSKTFKDLVKASPRNYSVVIMFTALSSSRGCVICRQANEEYSHLVISYRHSQAPPNRLFFGVVDFDEGSDIFQSLGLNSAPAFIHFPAKGKPKKRDQMDIQRLGFSAEAIAKWIAERTDLYIRVFRAPNHASTMILLTIIGATGILAFIKRNNLDFLANSNTWCALSILFVLFMISGQMWNHIRGPPFVHYTQSGGITYVHNSSQGQFVSETYFVMILYGLVILGVILLCEAGTVTDDKSGPGPGFRRIQAAFGLGLLIFFFSLILSMFRSKAGGYPYSFLFK